MRYIAPETEIFESFSWNPPNGMGLITDAIYALNMPKLKPTMATQSYTLTVCYCPNYDGPVDATNEACDDAPWSFA